MKVLFVMFGISISIATTAAMELLELLPIHFIAWCAAVIFTSLAGFLLISIHWERKSRR